MKHKRDDKVRTSTNGPNFHGMVRGGVTKTMGEPGCCKASPGGTRSGGMTPASWQGGGGGGKKRAGGGRMADGYPTSDGWIGWD